MPSARSLTSDQWLASGQNACHPKHLTSPREPLRCSPTRRCTFVSPPPPNHPAPLLLGRTLHLAPPTHHWCMDAMVLRALDARVEPPGSASAVCRASHPPPHASSPRPFFVPLHCLKLLYFFLALFHTTGSALCYTLPPPPCVTCCCRWKRVIREVVGRKRCRRQSRRRAAADGDDSH